MKDNIYLIKFCKLPTPIVNMVDWRLCYDRQLEIVEWCKENVNPEQGFPHWQLGGRSGTFIVPDVTADYDEFVPIFYEGVYIKDEQARLAFTLKFPFVVWT